MASPTFPLLLLLCCLMTTTESAKILCLTPCGPRSHYNVFVPFAEALASRGHDVTIISAFQSLKHPKIKEVQIDIGPKVTRRIESNFFETLVNSHDLLLRTFTPFMSEYCNVILQEDILQQLVASGKIYDLVIISGVIHECLLWLPPVVGRHVISLNPTGLVPWDYTTIPVPPSSVPMVGLGYSSHMCFCQRLENAWTQLKNRIYYHFVTVPTIEHIVHSHYPEALSIKEARRRISLTLSNADPVIYSPRPGIPDYVDIGAMHCRPARPIPEEFLDIIKRANGQGVILFSLGSVAPAKDLPLKIRHAFISAFSRLKQVVIWKFEEELSDLPPNLVITPWLPLQDLLGHNETRLFITHGGLLSTQEAVYHGVPMVGLPLFYDQIGNVARIQELGIGEKLEFNDLNEDIIYNTMQRILTDDSYYVNMRKYSSILRDQPQTPANRAVYWAEYVIRHDGAAHLKSPAMELTFVQYFLLDVAFVILAAILGFIFFISCIGRYAMKYFKRPLKAKKQ